VPHHPPVRKEASEETEMRSKPPEMKGAPTGLSSTAGVCHTPARPDSDRVKGFGSPIRERVPETASRPWTTSETRLQNSAQLSYEDPVVRWDDGGASAIWKTVEREDLGVDQAELTRSVGPVYLTSTPSAAFSTPVTQAHRPPPSRSWAYRIKRKDSSEPWSPASGVTFSS
jgi:hypothetical protein